MSTAEQVAANRQNAQSSTGPTSDDGKAASRLNALKHGLTAETPVLPTEDEATHGRFRAALLDDLAPVGLAGAPRFKERVLRQRWDHAYIGKRDRGKAA